MEVEIKEKINININVKSMVILTLIVAYLTFIIKLVSKLMELFL